MRDSPTWEHIQRCHVFIHVAEHLTNAKFKHCKPTCPGIYIHLERSPARWSAYWPTDAFGETQAGPNHKWNYFSARNFLKDGYLENFIISAFVETEKFTIFLQKELQSNW